MENFDKKQWGDESKDDGCGCGHHHGKHGLVKMILKLIIIIIIFWCGYQLGNITGYIRAEGGLGIMSNRANFGMMRGYSNVDVVPNDGGAVAPTATK